MPVANTDIFHVTEKDKNNHNGHEAPKYENFSGICEKRSSTDVLAFLLILAMWIAMTVIGARAIQNGNPFRLIDPYDSTGHICGHDPGVEQLPKLYSVSKLGFGVCVDSCPTKTANFSSTDMNDYYCLSVDGISLTNQLAFSTYLKSACMVSNKFVPGRSQCICNIKAASKSVFNRCVYKEDVFVKAFYTDGTGSNYIRNFMQDVMAAKEVIFGFGFGVAILLSFLWVVLMRGTILSHILVWGSLIIVQALLVIVVILAYTTAKKWKDEDPAVHSDREIVSLQVASIVFAVIGFLYFCLMIYLAKRIELAITVVSQAAKSLSAMPLLVFTPILNVLGMAAFMVPWVFYMLFLASDGTVNKKSYPVTYMGVTSNVYYTTISYDKDAEERLWFMWFCYLWTSNFVQAIGMLVIAVAVSNWYFTSPEAKSSVNSGTVCRAYGIVLRYHMGTAAFGSLIIAIVEFIRAIVLYLEKKAKKTFPAWVITFVFCWIHCCLWCIECCLKFISKNAYIQTAIHGTNFCTSCKNAFFLLARNILRIGALYVVSGVLLILGRVFVVVGASAASYYYLTGGYSDKVHGYIAPMVFVIFIAYFTAAMFMDVFQMAADTLIMCFIADEEIHDGVAKYGDKDLHEFVKTNGSLKEKDLDDHNEAVAARHGDGSAKYENVVAAKAT